jgi:hypothetical protein
MGGEGMGGRRRDVRLEIRQYKSQEKAAGLNVVSQEVVNIEAGSRDGRFLI